jgi:hypothetical protein
VLIIKIQTARRKLANLQGLACASGPRIISPNFISHSRRLFQQFHTSAEGLKEMSNQVDSEKPGTSPRLRAIAQWMAFIGVTLGAFGSFFLIFYGILAQPDIFVRILEAHFRAVLGIPLAALSSFCVVLAFEASLGQIEFEAIGFKFRGASGRVVLWVLCFLAIVTAIRVLW